MITFFDVAVYDVTYFSQMNYEMKNESDYVLKIYSIDL